MNFIQNPNAQIYDSTGTDYDVSVCVITYNKEAYIKDTIESVLMQETTCKYEIVVGDNLSTDGTRDILKNYWDTYPDKMTLIFNDKNLGLTTNMYNTLRKAKGKYIIILYGDDYWISPKKMQVQYDFLENNCQHFGVSAPIEQRYSGETQGFGVVPARSLCDRIISLADYLNGYDFPMAGLMFRNEVFSANASHFEQMIEISPGIDDASFCILFLMLGDVYVLPEVMSVYRSFRKEDNASNFNSVNTGKKRILMTMHLYNQMDAIYGAELDLRMRYGFVLASGFAHLVTKQIPLTDYHEIEESLPERYYPQRKRLLFSGVLRKLELRARKFF